MSLKYLLDTNICIYIIKNSPERVLQELQKLSIGEVAISVVTYGELLYGVKKSKFKKTNIEVLQGITSYIMPLPMSTRVAEYYGKICSELESKGCTIGSNDLWIAAHALDLDVILVTNNLKEFSRVPQLKLANWC